MYLSGMGFGEFVEFVYCLLCFCMFGFGVVDCLFL